MKYKKNRIQKNKKGFAQLTIIIVMAMIVVGTLIGIAIMKDDTNVDLDGKTLDISGKFLDTAEEASEDGEKEVILKSVDADATATLKFRIRDELNITSGVSYLNGTVVSFIAGEQESNSVVSTAATSVSVPFGKEIPYFVYGTGFYGVEDEVDANSNPKPVVAGVVKYPADTEINVEIFDQTANSFESNNYNTTTNTITMTSVSITAGTTKCYDIKMQINSAIKNYGSTGIYLAHDAPITKYSISLDGGSELDNMFNKMIDDGMKKGYELDLNGLLPGGHSLSGEKGLVTVATACVQLKQGQTGQNINWYIYDGAKFLSVDVKTVDEGIAKDDTSSTDVGAANPKIVMTV